MAIGDGASEDTPRIVPQPGTQMDNVTPDGSRMALADPLSALGCNLRHCVVHGLPRLQHDIVLAGSVPAMVRPHNSARPHLLGIRNHGRAQAPNVVLLASRRELPADRTHAVSARSPPGRSLSAVARLEELAALSALSSLFVRHPCVVRLVITKLWPAPLQGTGHREEQRREPATLHIATVRLSGSSEVWIRRFY